MRLEFVGISHLRIHIKYLLIEIRVFLVYFMLKDILMYQCQLCRELVFWV